MFWSKWKMALLAVVAGAGVTGAGAAGVAWTRGRTPALGRRALPVQIFTLHENGKAIRCRVLETFRRPEGSMMHRVQNVETGAIFELEEPRPSTVVPVQPPGPEAILEQAGHHRVVVLVRVGSEEEGAIAPEPDLAQSDDGPLGQARVGQHPLVGAALGAPQAAHLDHLEAGVPGQAP